MIEKYTSDLHSYDVFIPDGNDEFRPQFDYKELPQRDGLTIFPSFCDVHVHFREPGFSYKETIETGSNAAFHGGYTAVCTMPNLNPVPDSVDNLKEQLHLIEQCSKINIYPYGALTVGEKGEIPADIEGMAPYVIGFSDDGRGVQSEEMMKSLMQRCAALGKVIAAHCEDNSLLNGGYIHNGSYAKAHNHRGICSQSEWGPIKRDIRLAKETGCAYHVCHISCKESVELIRDAKASGVNVTCETAPHYLVMDENDLQEDGRFKMNPPLRSRDDRNALLEGIIDGTIDIIATDHAPHSLEEKSRGLEKSAFGITGLETSFPVLYTKLVKTGKVSLERIIDALVVQPRKRFAIPYNGEYCLWDLNKSFEVTEDFFVSKGKSTPFLGEILYGKACKK